MDFLWSRLLVLFLLIPLLIASYIWITRGRQKYAVRYSSLALIRTALPKRALWRQYLPFSLFLLSLVSLITALARPIAYVQVPQSRTTIILALDVSRSMCSTDVSPNRLTVAQEAALDFIEEQADNTRMGIVAFARFAEIVVPPTNDQEVLKEAISNFTTSIGTAIGSATLRSIDAIAEVNEAVVPSGVVLSPNTGETNLAGDFYQPDIIVLLTDGANTHGPMPLDAAQQAADRQVRVYTIGFGTTTPEPMVCTPQQSAGDPFSDGFGGGFGGGFDGGGNFRRFLLLDEPTLQGIADLTGGSYYRAENAEQLYQVFLDLPTKIVLQKERLEITFIFSVLGAILAVLAIGLSLLWRPLP